MAARQTVLIVEDDEAIADSVAYSLDRSGYRTLRAGDGAQALRLFRQQRPDLVILDLMLPQMDGWRVMDELRREDARVPVIVCSARTSEFEVLVIWISVSREPLAMTLGKTRIEALSSVVMSARAWASWTLTAAACEVRMAGLTRLACAALRDPRAAST